MMLQKTMIYCTSNLDAAKKVSEVVREKREREESEAEVEFDGLTFENWKVCQSLKK